MTTAEQWDGPIQGAIRRHDEQQGHVPKDPAEGRTTLLVRPLARTCCDPRPWQPICVDCPGRFRPDVPEETQ
jgi:hypothetical protein